MADQNTSLPIRTETNGDAVVQLCDGTVVSQKLLIDAAGRIIVKMQDGNGNAVTSVVAGSTRAQDVAIRNAAGTLIDPTQIRALTNADVVTSDQGAPNSTANSWPVKVTDGTNIISLTASGEVKVSVTQPLPAGTNTIGSVKITDGTNTASYTAAGEAKVSVTQPLPAGTNVLGGVTQSGTWNQRLQDGAGNAITSSAAGGTRPLDTALRDPSGALYSSSNPIPVAFSADITGTEVDAYNTASAIAAAASSNHDYTVTALKTLVLTQIEASASGKMKIEVQVEGPASTFTSKFVQFNSTAFPNMSIQLKAPISVAAGLKVRIIRTNLDKTAQDVYSTICGQEV